MEEKQLTPEGDGTPTSTHASGPEAESGAPTPESPDAPRPGRRVVEISAADRKPVRARVGRPAPPPPEEEPEMDFGAMFEATAGKGPSRFEEGDRLKGTVAYIGDENVFIDLGGKQEGYLSRGELVDDEGQLTVAVGQVIEAWVVSLTPGGVHLSQGLSAGAASLDSIRQAYSAGIPVEGKVSGSNKGGFEVEVLGQRGFCPMSQIDIRYTENPDEHVGQTYMFKLTKFDQRGKNVDIVLSRSELLRQERESQQRDLVATLEEGQIRTGVVRSLRPFGIFVDLGGLDGMVHVSEMSWHRLDDPADLVKIGETVTVKVMSIEDAGAGLDKMRIGLSIKQAQASPWDRVGTDFVEGDVYEGTVVRLAPYGAFIQLAEGLDGLAHVSELSRRRIAHPKDVLREGDVVRCQILSIDFERERIGLSLKELEDDPWLNATERYADGAEIHGTVEAIEGFGVFIAIEPGLTGLLPKSEMATEPGRDPNLDFKVGDRVEARILALDPVQRRLTLTRRSAEELSETRPARDGEGRKGGRAGGAAARTFYEDSGKAGGQGLGTLGDLLARKLQKGK